MPSFVSKDGVWFVKKEKVSLRNNSGKTITNPSMEGTKYFGEQVSPGEPFIYEGPDRAALFELFKLDPSGNITVLGTDFHDEPDMINRARQMGYKSVSEYAKIFGYNKEESEKRFSEQIVKIETHDLPKKVKMLQAAESGGHDTVGEMHMDGNFGEPPFLK